MSQLRCKFTFSAERQNCICDFFDIPQDTTDTSEKFYKQGIYMK